MKNSWLGPTQGFPLESGPAGWGSNCGWLAGCPPADRRAGCWLAAAGWFLLRLAGWGWLGLAAGYPSQWSIGLAGWLLVPLGAAGWGLAGWRGQRLAAGWGLAAGCWLAGSEAGWLLAGCWLVPATAGWLLAGGVRGCLAGCWLAVRMAWPAASPSPRGLTLAGFSGERADAAGCPAASRPALRLA